VRLRLDFYSKVPIYVQIVDQVKALVEAGNLAAGEQLPTVRALASELRINFNTVARAYRILHEESVISTQQGRGTYVLERSPAPDAKRLRRERLAALAEDWVEEAQRLGFRPEEVAQSLSNALQRLERKPPAR
jgi:GntR family transcriptional regulator